MLRWCYNNIFSTAYDPWFVDLSSMPHSLILFLFFLLDPILTLNYTGINAIDYNTLSPNNTSIGIPLYSTNVYLSANIATGTWSPPPPPLYDIPGAIISINLFTLISPGKYSFKTQESWNGEEKEVFSVDLTPTG